MGQSDVWQAAQEVPDGDARLSGGTHSFELSEPVTAPLIYNGDVYGRAVMHPGEGRAVTIDVYEPNLANRLAAEARGFTVTLGADPTASVVLEELSKS